MQSYQSEICQRLQGADIDFDMGGDGVLISAHIQVALVIICGVVPAFVSRCITSRAGHTTKLTVARLFATMDTVYTTASLLSLSTIVTGLVRAQAHAIAGRERSILRDLLRINNMAQMLAMAVHNIQKTPSNVKEGHRRWRTLPFVLCIQILIFLDRMLLNRLEKAPSRQAMLALCEEPSNATIPPLEPYSSPLSSYLFSLLFAVVLCIVAAAAHIWMPDRLLDRIKSFFTSKVILGIVAIFWCTMCLLSIFLSGWSLLHTRQRYEVSLPWDLAQTVAVLLWVPAIWQLLLVALTCAVPIHCQPGSEFASDQGHGGYCRALLRRMCMKH